MLEAEGQVWLRRHWLFSSFAFTSVLLLISALATPNLLRVRDAGRYAEVKSTEHGGVPRPTSAKSGTAQNAMMTFLSSDKNVPTSAAALTDRKIAYTGVMDLVVSGPAQGAEKIRQLAQSFGGYVESAQVSGSQDSASATTTIMVPAARFDEVMAELRSMAIRVDNEKTDAQDVTKQYVDTQAQLRNLRAEEAQYLQIMHSASKVQDMLDVSEKLSEVRGQIEQTQAEFATLSRQVEMVSIVISLRPEVQPTSFSWDGHPTQRLKISLHDAADGLANYGAAMAAVILYLPVILLWVLTVTLSGALLWRSLRWVEKVFFKIHPSAMIEKPAN